MSRYESLTTTIADEQYLVAALKEMGYTPEICRDGGRLYGYQGDERRERAHVIIRRNQLNSASNDIGFARDDKGVYRAIISEYDQGIGFNSAWLGRVTQAYKEKQTMAVARAKGYVLQGREVIETPQGRRVQLRFRVR